MTDTASPDHDHDPRPLPGRLDEELALRAGPPSVSPPLPIALMIFALGVLGPIVFVRDARPSVFLTAAALLLPVAGALAVIGSIESLRRRRGDRAVRARALIRADGVALMGRPGESEQHPWADIAAADATRTTLILHLHGEGGKRTRRAIRYGGLETPVELIRSRLAQGLKISAIDTSGDGLS